MTQSPFIFADLQMDTSMQPFPRKVILLTVRSVDAYDVNVSPDKRTILLHDQNELLESLKVRLYES